MKRQIFQSVNAKEYSFKDLYTQAQETEGALGFSKFQVKLLTGKKH